MSRRWSIGRWRPDRDEILRGYVTFRDERSLAVESILVELLILAAVLGVLAMLVVTAVDAIHTRAVESGCVDDRVPATTVVPSDNGREGQLWALTGAGFVRPGDVGRDPAAGSANSLEVDAPC